MARKAKHRPACSSCGAVAKASYGSIALCKAAGYHKIGELWICATCYGEAKKEKRPKFNNRKTVTDGHTFDSQAESDYYLELKQLQAAGEISDLKLQPVFVLQEGFRDSAGKKHQAITYRADFGYVRNGKPVVVDVKGMITDVFKIKMKLLLYRYPDLNFEIVQVRRGKVVELPTATRRGKKAAA